MTLKTMDDELLEGFASEYRKKKMDYTVNSMPLVTTKGDASTILKELQADKVGTIKEVIDEINKLIEQRENLSREFTIDIERIIMDINNVVSNLPDSERNKLTRELATLITQRVGLNEIKAKEKVEKWRDIAELKKELRERIKDFKEKESKNSMMDNLFE